MSNNKMREKWSIQFDSAFGFRNKFANIGKIPDEYKDDFKECWLAACEYQQKKIDKLEKENAIVRDTLLSFQKALSIKNGSMIKDGYLRQIKETLKKIDNDRK
jgi:hypothetical protein